MSPQPQGHGKDNDQDVVEENDGKKGVHVADEITRRGEMGGYKTFDAPTATDVFHEEVEQGAKQDANKEADKDIAQVVNA